MVSVVSGKGGVGKSVLALNLAERAAALGLHTLAVDLSLAAGNLHLMTNSVPRRGIEQYLAGTAILSQSTTPLSPTCDLLLRTNPGPLTAFDNTLSPAAGCGRLRHDASEYDLVIVDHGSGMSTVSTTIARHSDISLLIVVPELTSIADGYGLFKYLIEQNRQSDCRLVINRAKSATDADYLAERFVEMTAKFLRVSPRLAGWIGDDSLISESINAQRPLSAMSRQSVVVEQVSRLSQVLHDEIMSRNVPLATTDQSDRRGSVTPQTTINNSPATADIKG
jgi:flagellar biosynthesis protein FlhG